MNDVISSSQSPNLLSQLLKQKYIHIYVYIQRETEISISPKKM
jgi:hypothetical protein